jgi:alkylhydroperoxidase family enzyme
LDDDLIAALRRDYKTAPITEREKVMLDYVVQLTRDATRITPEHHRTLAEAGFDDRARLQITLIASWFNYINRVADALGVARGTLAEVAGAGE